MVEVHKRHKNKSLGQFWGENEIPDVFLFWPPYP